MTDQSTTTSGGSTLNPLQAASGHYTKLRRQKLERYRDLLGREQCSDEEAAELARLMDDLGKTPEDAKADRTAVLKVQRGERAKAKLPEVEKKLHDAEAERDAFAPEYRRIIDEAEATRRRHLGAVQMAESAFHTHRGAIDEAEKTRQQRPDLFG